MKDSFLKNILINLRTFFKRNISKEINTSNKRISELESRISLIVQGSETWARNSFCYNSLLQYFEQSGLDMDKYSVEVDFLRKLGHYCNFPYPITSPTHQHTAGYDHNANLPYIVHDGKKLYFPSTYTVEDAIKQYNHLTSIEKILSIENSEPAPHCYQSMAVRISQNDILLDIGSAEGLFALDNISMAKQIIIVECDPLWHECLHRTFAPYRDKVFFIEKALGNKDDDSHVTLSTLLNTYASSHTFIKMDIEGGELPSLLASEHYLESYSSEIKLSVAAYHKQHDADMLKQLFDNLKFRSEFSKGYMLFNDYDMPLPPFFRHGVIRAANLTK